MCSRSLKLRLNARAWQGETTNSGVRTWCELTFNFINFPNATRIPRLPFRQQSGYILQISDLGSDNDQCLTCGTMFGQLHTLLVSIGSALVRLYPSLHGLALFHRGFKSYVTTDRRALVEEEPLPEVLRDMSLLMRVLCFFALGRPDIQYH
ncbi:hypothetical protein DFJ58DRAFT_449588 [Suillus subalutaceus]|uniref:uncharacterized protein n=1 Tax=Suillus subalutaceus TaxID=48586 RepID=UPI001B8706A3|nr:uncharacterized protein DFJ58DRAFT_449588 [Suillus subalutaceus]KAG1849659.1 hypothetical protein DFJ58DRAFT_449588 [Suillus subalutaceus]